MISAYCIFFAVHFPWPITNVYDILIKSIELPPIWNVRNVREFPKFLFSFEFFIHKGSFILEAICLGTEDSRTPSM